MLESNALDRILPLLRQVKRAGSGWIACCPAHDDQKPSLSIGEGENGKVLLNCHAGCALEAIVAALGLKLADLFPPEGAAPAAVRPKGPPPKQDGGAQAQRVVAKYPYCDAGGTLLFEVVRFEPKGFQQRRPDGNGGWIWKLDGTPRVLYRLPELLTADRTGWVFVCEGEKDVDNVRALGLTATCNPCGAGKWARLADDSALHGRRVAIIPDDDPPEKKHAGQRHAQDVAARLYGKAAEVRIVDLRKEGGFMGKDVTDWLDAHDSTEPADLARALTEMAEGAPKWTRESAEQDSTMAAGPSPVLLNMADVQPEPVKWLWPSRIALGKLTIIAGDPNLGKSFITLDMAARVSTGGGWPDAPAYCMTPGGVVLLSAEDDPADTIRPRLDAANADVKRVSLLKAVQEADRTGVCRQRIVNLGEDVEALEDAIARSENCRLVVIDPISAYLGKADSYVNAEVRGVLAPLSELAARRGVAVVAVTHLRKSEGAAMYRAMGSMAFVAAARAVYAVMLDPKDERRERRLFLPVKNNLAISPDGLAYRLFADEGEIPHVAWESDPVKAVADDILSMPVSKPGPAPDERNDAAEWLHAELANGPRPTLELLNKADEVGIRKRTLRRAKEKLGVQAKKTDFDGQWTWELPNGSRETPQRAADSVNLALLGEPGALRESPNENAESETRETPKEDEECQECQVK